MQCGAIARSRCKALCTRTRLRRKNTPEEKENRKTKMSADNARTPNVDAISSTVPKTPLSRTHCSASPEDERTPAHPLLRPLKPRQNPHARGRPSGPNNRRTKKLSQLQNACFACHKSISRSLNIWRTPHVHAQRPLVERLMACVPMLPTRPLVLRTLVLPSVLRLGEDRLPTLRVPTPLPKREVPPGVLGARVGDDSRSSMGSSSSSMLVGCMFSPSLVSVRPSHLVVVVVVVVQEMARRLPLRVRALC